MITQWESKIATAMDCTWTSARIGDTPDAVASSIRKSSLDSAEIAETKRRLESTEIEPEFCRAVAALL